MARKDDETSTPKFTMDQLSGIVAAGMGITEARALLEDGYRPEDVLALAQLQAEAKQEQAAAAMKDAAKVAADHTEKVRNPSNKSHPGISAFSYPEGDRARPKGTDGRLPFEFLYNGYPCHKFLETEHWRECELMLQTIKPGDYPIVRKDSSLMTATVRVERDGDGNPTKVDVQFPVSREDKPLIPAKAVVLYQIVHAGEKRPQQLYVEAMNEWLTITLGDPVGV